MTTNSTGANETLIYEIRVTRDLYIVSNILTSDGSYFVNWTQHLSYSSSNALLSQGLTQLTSQDTVGVDTSSSGYANTYHYPLAVNSSFFADATGNFGIHASLSRALDYNIFGPSIFPSGIQNLKSRSPSTVDNSGSPMLESRQTPANFRVFDGALLSTIQSGSAEYLSAGNLSYSYGKTEQDFSFKGAKLDSHELPYELYNRRVIAVNSAITEDSQNPAGKSLDTLMVQLEQIQSPATLQAISVKAMLGRGPGKTKAELAGITST